MIAIILGPFAVLVLFVVIPALGIGTAIDAGTKPPWAFERAGQNKTLWIVLPLVGIFVCGVVTIVSAIIWFASIRPKVVAAQSGGSPWAGAAPQWNAGAPIPAQSAPANPSAAVPAQWSPDPVSRHELRYWDGTAWTEHVSDAGVTSTDPL